MFIGGKSYGISINWRKARLTILRQVPPAFRARLSVVAAFPFGEPNSSIVINSQRHSHSTILTDPSLRPHFDPIVRHHHDAHRCYAGILCGNTNTSHPSDIITPTSDLLVAQTINTHRAYIRPEKHKMLLSSRIPLKRRSPRPDNGSIEELRQGLPDRILSTR
jgi:hypothetical protein